MKRFFLFTSMAVAAGLVLSNVYNSIVDVPAWGHNIPASLDTARQYFSVSNPGDFFRIFSPLNQMLGLLCVLLFWKRSKAVRYLLLSAFACYAIGEGLTFLYFYPRNEILFQSTVSDAAQLKTLWQQWQTMNWVRTLVIAAGTVCSALALHRSYAVAQGQQTVVNAGQRRTERVLVG